MHFNACTGNHNIATIWDRLREKGPNARFFQDFTEIHVIIILELLSDCMNSKNHTSCLMLMSNHNLFPDDLKILYIIKT